MLNDVRNTKDVMGILNVCEGYDDQMSMKNIYLDSFIRDLSNGIWNLIKILRIEKQRHLNVWKGSTLSRF